MSGYFEVKSLLKNANSALTDEDILKEIGAPPKKRNDKNYSMLEVGNFAKNLAKKMADKTKSESLYISKSVQEDCALEKENGHLGIKFDTFFLWIEKLAKDKNIITDREKIKKVLASQEYSALRITESFFNPGIRSFASQLLLKGVK